MNFLIPFEHLDELPNLPGTGLSLLRGLDPEKNRITVLTVESLKEGLRARIGIQCCLEIPRHTGATWRIISVSPASIFLGTLHCFQPRWLHDPAFDQRQSLPPVDLRPDARVRTRTKLLQPRLIRVAIFLSVNPSVTQSHFEGFTVSHRLHSGRLFRRPHPQAIGLAMILLQPRSPVVAAAEPTNRGGVAGAVTAAAHRAFSASDATPVRRFRSRNDWARSEEHTSELH